MYLHISVNKDEKKKKKSKKGKLKENHKEGKECKERKKEFKKNRGGGAKVTKTGAGRRSKDRTEGEPRMENQYVFMYSPQPLCFLCCYCVFGMLTCSGLWRLCEQTSMSRACLYVCLKCLCSA